jgi:hypothetical protein
MTLRRRVARLEAAVPADDEAGRLAAFCAAYRVFEEGAQEARVGRFVVTRAEYEAARDEGRRRVEAYRRERGLPGRAALTTEGKP